MCSGRKLSFRIDDILQSQKDKIEDHSNAKSDHESKQPRTTAFSSETSCFRPYTDVKESSDRLTKYEGCKKYEEKDYYHARLGYPYGYVPSRFQQPCNYFESYAYNNVLDQHWRMPPGFVNYGIGGCSSLSYNPYMRPMSLSNFAKRKGGQVRFTPQQTQNLEKRFGAHKYLSPEDRRVLAGQLKLTDRQVKTWFQNRRAKWRRANSSSALENEEVESDNQSEEDVQIDKESFKDSNKNSPIFVG